MRVLLILLAILFPISINGNGTELPGNCQQPPNTSMLIYNQDDKKIKTQKTPAGICECSSDPTKKIAFFSPGFNNIPPTGPFAGNSPINMQCSEMQDFCVCDESDVCWSLKNAYAELVINSYCDSCNYLNSLI